MDGETAQNIIICPTFYINIKICFRYYPFEESPARIPPVVRKVNNTFAIFLQCWLILAGFDGIRLS